MFASVHIVRYPSLWRALWGFLETRRRIAREPGVRFRHAMIAGQSAVPVTYTPDQNEFPRLRNIFPFHVTWAYRLEPSIALLILWEREEALDRFLAGSSVLGGWRAVASEVWHVRLRAIFAKGTWVDGGQRFPAIEPRPLGNRPIVSVVHVRPSYRSLRRFWPTMQSVIETAATQPGLIAMATGVDRVLTSGTSISFWRSPKDAMAFGYRHPSHAAALERSDAERWLTASFMARFVPYASSGSIHGVDPLAAILTNKDSMQSREVHHADLEPGQISPCAKDHSAVSIARAAEIAFTESSDAAFRQQEKRRKSLASGLDIATIMPIAALGAAGWFYFGAAARAKEAQGNLSSALAALSFVESQRSPVEATRYVLAGWPRHARGALSKKGAIIDAMSAAMLNLHERLRLTGLNGAVSSAVFSPDASRVVAASDDKTAPIWDAQTGTVLRELKGHGGPVVSAAFSPDGARVLTASYDWTARIWDAQTGAVLKKLKGHGVPVSSAAFSPDGARVVTASFDTTARSWDARTGAVLKELRGHDGPVSSAAFSPDGARVVTASSDNTARIWDAKTGVALLELNGHDNWVTSAAFSPDGARVVTAAYDKTARIWDAQTGAVFKELKGHDGVVHSAAFSPDGARVVTASGDTTACIWDAQTGAALLELKGHGEGVLSAAFSPDGAHVVTASYDNTARIWHISRLQKGTVFEVACKTPEGLGKEYGLKIDQPILRTSKRPPLPELPMTE